MKLTFRSKLALGFGAVSVCVLGAAFIGFRYEFRLSLLRDHSAEARTRARRIARRYLHDRLPTSSKPPASSVARGFVILDATGTREQARSPGLAPVAIPPSVLEKVLARPGGGTTVTLTLGDGVDYRAYIGLRPPRDDEAPGSDPIIVACFESLANVDNEVAELFEPLVKTLPFAIVVGLAAAWLAAIHLARPLESLAQSASRVSFTGERELIRGSGAGDGFDSLADTLNDVFERLREAYARQERFTADAAHELRTPVTAILGRTGAVLNRPRTADEYRVALEDVLDAAQRAADTVESLMTMAGLERGAEIKREALDVCALIEGVVARSCGIAGGARLALVQKPCEPCYVIGDGVLLATLFRNVLENARVHGQSTEPVEVSVDPSPRSVIIEVRDHGPGIAEKSLQRVFDRLYRLDSARSRRAGGVGLGLSIARAIVELHGGSIHARNAATGGAIIGIELPVAPRPLRE